MASTPSPASPRSPTRRLARRPAAAAAAASNPTAHGASSSRAVRSAYGAWKGGMPQKYPLGSTSPTNALSSSTRPSRAAISATSHGTVTAANPARKSSGRA